MKASTLNPERIVNDLVPQKFGRRGMVWTGFLILISLVGIYAYYRQLAQGLVVTNMGDYVLGLMLTLSQ